MRIKQFSFCFSYHLRLNHTLCSLSVLVFRKRQFKLIRYFSRLEDTLTQNARKVKHPLHKRDRLDNLFFIGCRCFTFLQVPTSVTTIKIAKRYIFFDFSNHNLCRPFKVLIVSIALLKLLTVPPTNAPVSNTMF